VLWISTMCFCVGYSLNFPKTLNTDINVRAHTHIYEHTFYANFSAIYLCRNTWKVLKCGAGEGWKRSVGPSM